MVHTRTTINKLYTLMLRTVITSVLIAAPGMSSVDNPHFYRARLWLGEPRMGQDGLSSLDVYLFGAATHSSSNSQGFKAPLLALHGPENLAALGVDLPNVHPDHLHSSFCGYFDLLEAQLNSYVNFTHGFFGRAHIPIRTLMITDIDLRKPALFDDTSWRTVEKQLNHITKAHGLSIKPVHETGVGDLSLLAGWTGTTYDTCTVDFIDASIQAGILLPTGKKRNVNEAFSLPLGYNGHIGFPVHLDAATGFFDWLNIGLHAEALFFCNAHECMRLAQHENETGFIRLAEPKSVRVHSGPIWNLSAYVKADHFIDGLSFLFGISHDQKQHDRISCNTAAASSLVNNDPLLHGWTMNVLHMILDADCCTDENPYGPRASLYYNYIIDGKNIFNASGFGGSVGLDIVWCF